MSNKKDLLKTLGHQCKNAFFTSALLAMEVCKDCKDAGKRVVDAIKNK